MSLFARVFAVIFVLIQSAIAGPVLMDALFREARGDSGAYEGLYDNTYYRGYGSPGMNMRFEGGGNRW